MDERNGDGGATARVGRPRLVLVVDSDYQRRIYAAQLLAELGFRVVLAADAGAAESVLERQSERLDAVLVNLAEALEPLRRSIEKLQSNAPIIDAAAADYTPESLSRLLGPGRK